MNKQINSHTNAQIKPTTTPERENNQYVYLSSKSQVSLIVAMFSPAVCIWIVEQKMAFPRGRSLQNKGIDHVGSQLKMETQLLHQSKANFANPKNDFLWIKAQETTFQFDAAVHMTHACMTATPQSDFAKHSRMLVFEKHHMQCCFSDASKGG